MNNKRIWLFRGVAIAILLIISACMMVIGRGHTVYFDNKALEYEGKTYESPYKIAVYVKDEQVAKLYDKERGMSVWIGQDFNMSLEITETKGGSEETQVINVKLPYSMDGVVLNLPGLLAGLPQEAYLTEFVSNIDENPTEEAPSGDSLSGDDLSVGEF